MAIHDHKSSEAVNCMIITVSDTRTKETDKSGILMEKLLKEAGHNIKRREIVKDDKENIRSLIVDGAFNSEVDVILTNGGTGISYRDVTYETIQQLLDKELTGFGEIFRMLRDRKSVVWG